MCGGRGRALTALVHVEPAGALSIQEVDYINLYIQVLIVYYVIWGRIELKNDGQLLSGVPSSTTPHNLAATFRTCVLVLLRSIFLRPQRP